MNIHVVGKDAIASGDHTALIDLRHNLPVRRQEINAGLKFELSLANIRYVNSNYPSANWDNPDAIQRLLCAENDKQELSELAHKDIPPEAYAFAFKTEPYDHQLRAFYRSKDAEAFALLLEQGCVDSETEYLSPTGWVKISDYADGKVAQWLPDTNEIEFVEPLAYVKKPCPEMIRIKTARGVDQMLSPEHRMPVINGYTGKMSVMSAEDFKALIEKYPRTSRRLPSTFCYSPNGGGIGLNENDLRLQIAVMADGSFPKHSPHTKKATLRIKKKRKIDRLLRLLRDSGTEYKLTKESSGFHVFRFAATFRKKSYDSFFWNANDKDLDIIIDEIFRWDGTRHNGRFVSFYSTNKGDADFIQYAFASRGHIASINKDIRKGRATCYQVYVRKRTCPYHIKGCSSYIKTEPSTDGFKYCFEVPSTFLLFRRNGNIFPSGNTGKSKVVCDKAAYSYSVGRIDGLLITAPNGVHRQWVSEQVPTHLPEFVRYDMIAWQSSHTKKWLSDFEYVMNQPKDKLRIISMNIEALSSPKGVKFCERILNSGNFLWCLDESSRIKTPSSKRTRAILKLAPLAKERLILSGTPVTQGIQDLYTQFKFLNPDILGFNSFYTFRDHYCYVKPIPGAHVSARKIVGYKNVDELKKAIEAYSIRVTKADCLDLPEKVYMTREVPLTAEQKKHYKELADDLRTQLESGELVSAPLAVTKLMKLQQVLCGFLVPEVGDAPVEIKSDRASATIDLISEAAGKAIVWCRFKHDIRTLKALCDKAGIRAVTHYGETTPQERVAALKDFKTLPDCKVFIANPASAGIGLNLTEADTAIYYSNDFSAESRQQSEDRIHRIGQANHCTYIDLLAPCTVDGKIIDALKKKKNVADSVLDVKEFVDIL